MATTTAGMSRHYAVFQDESSALLAELERALLELATGGDAPARIDTVFRTVHSLRGTAASIGFDVVAGLAWSMEQRLARWRSGAGAPDLDSVRLLLDCGDAMAELIAAGIAGLPVDTARASALAARCGAAQPRAAAGDAGRAPAAPPAAERGSLRVDVAELDALLAQSRALCELHDELCTAAGASGATIAALAGRARALHEGALRLRLQRVGALYERLPRLVQGYATRLGKQVELKLTGEALQCDGLILDRLADAVLHLVHNALDHGIEPPQRRLQAGKPPAGTLEIAAAREGSCLRIEVADDGHGIDRAAIRRQAAAAGLTREGEHLNDEGVLALLCRPGFTTAAAPGSLSGRGVGLDAVRARVEALGGSLTLHSHSGAGTRIALRVPCGIWPAPGAAEAAHAS